MTPHAAHIPRTAAAAPIQPAHEVQKRAIAQAVWTDLLWLMPQDRTVTVTVRDGMVAVDLGPADPAADVPAH